MPTTVQSVLVNPGCAIFMLNSKRCPRADSFSRCLIIRRSSLKSKASMIFHKALVREFANTALATFFVLLGITFTTQLVRLLSQAAIGVITSTGVLVLLGF